MTAAFMLRTSVTNRRMLVHGPTDGPHIELDTCVTCVSFSLHLTFEGQHILDVFMLPCPSINGCHRAGAGRQVRLQVGQRVRLLALALRSVN